MSEIIESASALDHTHAHAADLADATAASGGADAASAGRSATPAEPPSIHLSPTPMKPSARWTAQSLEDHQWSLSSRIPFVPDNFLVMPESLQLPPAGLCDWRDPLGSQTARINATPLSLKPADAQRAGHTRTSREGVTNWSQFTKQPVVLQMQSVAEPTSRAAGGLATALLATGTTDLIVVDALVRDPQAPRGARPGAASARMPALTQSGTGYPAAFPRANPVTDVVTDRLEYTFPSGAPYASVSTVTRAPTKPRAGMPQGELTISLKGADGRAFTHPVRTHTLNLNAPDWAHQLMFALNVRYLEGEKKPLQLALMCKDGATASGVVATALHAMECLETLNRGDIQMRGEDELAARLDDFIAAGKSVRSPAFAEVNGKPLDTRKMASDIWKAWISVQSKPDSVAVQTLRQSQRDDGVELDTDDATPLLDAVDGLATAAQTDTSSVGRLSRWTSRLLSSSSEDSGVLSDTTFSSSQFSTLAQAGRATALPPMQEVQDAEADSPTLSPTTSPTTSPTSTLSPRKTPEQAIDLPTADGMRARRFHPASQSTDAEVQALLADLTAPASRAVRLPSEAAEAVEAVEGAVATPRPSPLRTVMTLNDSRKAAQEGGERVQTPRHIRSNWMPGGPKFNAYYPRLDGLVKEMTARTGLVGFLRARFTDPQTRRLEPHTHWARDVIEDVQADIIRDLQSRAGPSSDPVPDIDHAQVAAAAHEAVQRLIARRFDDLTPREQARWRERVDGRSPRFQEAMATSRERVHELPRRFLANGALSERPLTAEPPKTQAPPIFMRLHQNRPDIGRSADDALRPRGGDGMRTPEGIRQIVDREWATQWVLHLTRQVAGAGR